MIGCDLPFFDRLFAADDVSAGQAKHNTNGVAQMPLYVALLLDLNLSRCDVTLQSIMGGSEIGAWPQRIYLTF